MTPPKTVPLEDEVRPTSPPKVNSTTPKLSAVDKKLRDSVQSYYTSMGMLVHTFGMVRSDPRFLASAENIVSKSESIADAWIKLANQNQNVKKALQAFVETSAVAEVVGLHVACLTPFLIGAIPADLAAGLAAAAAAQEPPDSPSSNGSGH